MFGDTFLINEVSLRALRNHGVDDGNDARVLISFAVEAGFEVEGIEMMKFCSCFFG